jgi:NAD(P)-dependent dehydrogenase (short-subunit alcohol dehydrogenase family)
VISSRKQVQVDETVASFKSQGFEATGCVCHQGKAEDRKALIEHAISTYGKIDVVVLNAAVQPAPATGPTLAVPDEFFDKVGSRC